MRIARLLLLLTAASNVDAQGVREPYPYERLDQVPSRVSIAADRAAIEDFVVERHRLLQWILDRSQAKCPALLSGEITAREFAENVDREDAAAMQAIAEAYLRMQARMTLRGKAELDQEFASRRGYAVDGSVAAKYDEIPYEMERRLKWRCEVGFPETGQRPDGGTFSREAGE